MSDIHVAGVPGRNSGLVPVKRSHNRPRLAIGARFDSAWSHSALLGAAALNTVCSATETGKQAGTPAHRVSRAGYIPRQPVIEKTATVLTVGFRPLPERTPCVPARENSAGRRPAGHRIQWPFSASLPAFVQVPACGLRFIFRDSSRIVWFSWFRPSCSWSTWRPGPFRRDARTAPEPARPAIVAGLNSARPGPPTAPAQRMTNPRCCARQLLLSRARSQQAQLRAADGPCFKAGMKTPWQCDCKSKMCSLIRGCILQINTTRYDYKSGPYLALSEGLFARLP